MYSPAIASTMRVLWSWQTGANVPPQSSSGTCPHPSKTMGLFFEPSALTLKIPRDPIILCPLFPSPAEMATFRALEAFPEKAGFYSCECGKFHLPENDTLRANSGTQKDIFPVKNKLHTSRLYGTGLPKNTSGHLLYLLLLPTKLRRGN